MDRWWRVICFVAALMGPSPSLASADVSLLMPNVQPQQNDIYLCMTKKVDDSTSYITGFQPSASMAVAHHILIYGCLEPGFTEDVWNCGEMHAGAEDGYRKGPVCKDSGRIIYAWAMDAPDLKLPDDVAFKIGAGTAMKYLVMQVHYMDVSRFLPPSLEKDNSGVTLSTTTTPRAKTAGVYLIAANGRISPGSVTYMEAACAYQEPADLHPFAFRVHTHKLGRVVTGYRIRDGKWSEIGRKNPQTPQMFYPVDESADVDITKGDVLAARCTMENKGSRTVEVGPTASDEMCNFYIMYYTSGDGDIQNPVCVSPGPPNWKWSDFSGINPEDIPFQASVDPLTNNWFKEYERRMNDWAEEMRQESDNLMRQFSESYQSILGKYPDFAYQNRKPMDYFSDQYQDAYPQYGQEYSVYPSRFGNGDENGNSQSSFGATLKKDTVLSQAPVSSNSVSYKLQNGKPVKVSETQKTYPAPPPASNEGPVKSSSSTKYKFQNGKPVKVDSPSSSSTWQGSSKVASQSASSSAAKYKFVNGKLEKVSETQGTSGSKGNAEPSAFKMPPMPPMSEFPSLNFPSIDVSLGNINDMINSMKAEADKQGGEPKVSESYSSYSDGNGNGGYNHNKESSSFQKLNIPGGSGYVKSSSSSSSSSSHSSSKTSI